MKQYAILALIYLMFILVSCKYTCPDFPESELKYIPYNLNDSIRYSNKSDTIEFIVTDYYKTEENIVKTELPVMDLKCEEKANYSTDKNFKIGCYIKESYDISKHFNVEFDSKNIFSFSLYNNYYEEGIIKREFKEQFEINGIIYYNCIILEKELSQYLIWKIVKADNFGIIEIYHKDYQDPWRIIN